MFEDLVKKNRSYRRFYESEAISRETLLKLVDYARLAPSATNRQPLRYYISCDRELNGKIFPALRWASYLTEWVGPDVGERPSAYIVIVQDERDKRRGCVDYGIAAQNILLGGVEMGLGGCMIGNLDRPVLREALHIPDNYEMLLVVALGKPKECIVIDEIKADGDIKYWRDDNQTHHVPKRKLEDIIIN